MISTILINIIYALASTVGAVSTPEDNPMSDIPTILNEKRVERFAAVNTNFVGWCGGIMNIGAEFQIADKVSFKIPVFYSPWFISDSHSIRAIAFQPEARWWISKSGIGHFAGPHLSLGWYNLKFGNFRYQDRGRPAFGAGITYGYSLPLKRAFNLEFSVGVGWLSFRYDRFHNVPNGAFVDLRQTSYFGIDHASVSLSYHFPL